MCTIVSFGTQPPVHTSRYCAHIELMCTQDDGLAEPCCTLAIIVYISGHHQRDLVRIPVEAVLCGAHNCVPCTQFVRMCTLVDVTKGTWFESRSRLFYGGHTIAFHVHIHKQCTLCAHLWTSSTDSGSSLVIAQLCLMCTFELKNTQNVHMCVQLF
jgi:hypothetical protein